MRIVFWNTAGNGNIGDELCYRGAVEFCQKKYHHFTFKQIWSLNKRTIEWVKNAQLLVIGGGQLIDNSSILKDLKRVYESTKLKTPVEFVGVGIGSSDDIQPYHAFLKDLDAEWNVRDKASVAVLCENGFQSQINGAVEDLSNQLDLTHGHSKGLGFAGLNLKYQHKNEGFIRDLAEVCDQWVDPVKFYAFNSCDRQKVDYYGEDIWISDCNDEALGDKILDYCEEDNFYVEAFHVNEDDPIEYVSRIGQANYIITERLHCAILAHRFGIPFRAIAYHDKIDRFLNMYDLGKKTIKPDVESIEKAMYSLREEAKDRSLKKETE